MATYTLLPPDRRTGDPSSAELGLLQQMQGPGANQMIGFLNAARLDREGATQRFNVDREEYNIGQQQNQQRADEVAAEQAAARMQNALRAATINRHGAQADSQMWSLIPPEARQNILAREAAQTDLLENRAGAASRSGTGGGGTSLSRERFEYTQDRHRQGDERRDDAATARAYDTAVRQQQAALRAALQASPMAAFNPTEAARVRAQALERFAAEYPDYAGTIARGRTRTPAPTTAAAPPTAPEAPTPAPTTQAPARAAPAATAAPSAAPVRVANPAEAQALAPGTLYQGPDGVTRRR